MKVVFDFASQKIAIEGDEPQLVDLLQSVRALAPALSHIVIMASNEPSGAPPVIEQPPAMPPSAIQNSAPPHSGQTLKQFIRQLRLTNSAERLTSIAYYMKHHEGRESFAPREMDSWFTFAGLQKPSQMAVALFDSRKRHGYVESYDRGSWRITTAGENLVVGKLNDAISQAD